MKLQFDSNTRTDKNRQCITGGIFYCRLVLKSTVVARIKLRIGLDGLASQSATKTYRQSVGSNPPYTQNY